MISHMPRQGRWVMWVIIVVGAATVGRKKLEPLWDFVRHDPIMGALILIVLLLLVMVIVRIVQA